MNTHIHSYQYMNTHIDSLTSLYKFTYVVTPIHEDSFILTLIYESMSREGEQIETVKAPPTSKMLPYQAHPESGLVKPSRLLRCL